MTKWVEALRREEIRQEVRDDAAGRYERDDQGSMAYRIKLYKLGLRAQDREQRSAPPADTRLHPLPPAA